MPSQEWPWWPCPGSPRSPGPAHRRDRCIHTSSGVAAVLPPPSGSQAPTSGVQPGERLVVTGRAGWMGMGRGAGRSALGFWPTLAFLLCSFPAAVSPCKILKCNSEFWSATAGSHSPASDDAPEFCAALRTYALCTRRTARTCRGDLAYHSAVHGIEDLMSQYNCSKDGPTSQPRLRTLPPPGDSQERSDSPEICHYEKSFHKHSAAPNYTHCGLFGDPHLRTFTDRFQTCKVQGAWPLIDNNYLNVQVTNTPVLPGSAATATTKDLLARPSLCPSHATSPRAPEHKIQPRPGHPGPPQPAAPHRTRRCSNHACVCGSQEDGYLWSPPPSASPPAAWRSPSSPAAGTSRHGPPCCPRGGCVLTLEPPPPPPVFLSLTGALLSFFPLLTSEAWLGDPSGQPCHSGLCRPRPVRSLCEPESVLIHLPLRSASG
uniref:repulsive guidance molecule A isoform X4 n=1 Tax=Halichoerus grypus TaxID=9711 RepID=UPI001659DC90|nr:repulsive guidance molecule A isoform X4 [Halichoerus grypus]